MLFTFLAECVFALQTNEIVVDELRGRNHFVPVTLIREKGTYGTVTVNFQVRRNCSNHEEKCHQNTKLYSLYKGQLLVLVYQILENDVVHMFF